MSAPPLRWRRNDRIGPIGDSKLCRAPNSGITGRIGRKADTRARPDSGATSGMVRSGECTFTTPSRPPNLGVGLWLALSLIAPTFPAYTDFRSSTRRQKRCRNEHIHQLLAS
jgi:hypothetical protein